MPGYSSDVEAAAELLKVELAVEAGLLGVSNDDDDDFAPPPEKERKRIVLIVSCVALAITIFAASLVGFTLGLSDFLDGLNPNVQRQFNNSLLSSSAPTAAMTSLNGGSLGSSPTFGESSEKLASTVASEVLESASDA